MQHLCTKLVEIHFSLTIGSCPGSLAVMAVLVELLEGGGWMSEESYRSTPSVFAVEKE